MQETWVQSLGQENPLEEDLVTQCSILPAKILWTEEPGGLQSMRLQRIRYHWATNITLKHNSAEQTLFQALQVLYIQETKAELSLPLLPLNSARHLVFPVSVHQTFLHPFSQAST